jgi:serine/threonine-protein kinase
MPIANGTRFGPYEIVGWLGAGGMGEVYRARDVRLGRLVAIKLIPERLAGDATRLDRFRQEARAAGQLNHPNITAVYDSGVHAGVPYIVSELLEGESLRARLHAGPPPVNKAIEYACQIANGLAAAHDKGILHRDLKPDNMFVTADGRVKILDFGVAKLLQPHDDAALPTLQETEPGMIMGTVNYMSPEQVRGEPLDVRSDIFSFGIVLREMLTGRQPFGRATTADTMAAILKEEPSGEFPAAVAPALVRIVSRCLEKSRESRFQSARDLAFGLQFLSGAGAVWPADPEAQGRPRMERLPWAVAAVLAIVSAVSIGAWAPWKPARSPEPVRLVADLGADAPLAPINVQYGNAFELSPDGSTIAFVARASVDARPLLYLRNLNQTRAVALAGTENAVGPFFSPDGRWIAFYANTKLKKIAATGGAPIVLADSLSSRGGSWAADGTIVFQPDSTAGRPLLRVSAAGGKTETLTAAGEAEPSHVWPQVLPSGRAMIYTSSSVPGAMNDANLLGQSLSGGPPKVILRGGYHGRYVASGHLIFIHNGALFAARFDPERLEITGEPVLVIDDVMSNAITGGAQFSVSAAGTLAYLPGRSVGGGTRLEWMDRMGKTTTLRATLANWLTPAFAPDGSRLAMEIIDGATPGNIWVYEPARDAMTRVTTGPAQHLRPVWTPDGTRIAFASNRASVGTPNLYWAPADGSGEAERLTTSANAQQPGSWHPSGEFLAFEERNPTTKLDVMILPLHRDASGWKAGAARPFRNTQSMEWDPMFSPDGRWLAYASDDLAGHRAVFVEPFPGPGDRVDVSVGGGEAPVWSRTKPELLYGIGNYGTSAYPAGQIMAVTYTTEQGTFRASTPQPWSPGRYQTRGETIMFDLHPDGERVALAPASEAPNIGRQDQAVFIFNFFDELNRRAAASSR